MSHSTPLILLSSGLRARYREDVVRALALPTGRKLQFRYRKRHIESALVKNLKSLTGRTVFICYLECSDPNRQIRLLPVRSAKIGAVEAAGEKFIFTLIVEKYFSSPNDAAKLIEADKKFKVPAWKTPADGGSTYASGLWAQGSELSLSDFELVKHNRDGGHLLAFENTAVQLGATSDFSSVEERLFFNLVALEEAGKRYEFGPSPTFKRNGVQSVLIHHLTPNMPTGPEAPTLFLKYAVFGHGLEPIHGNLLKIDSEYDLKRLRLDVKKGVRDTINSLSIGRTSASKPDELQDSEVEVEIRVRSSQWKVLLNILFIMSGIAAAGIVAAGSSLTLNKALLILFAAFIAAASSVLGYKTRA
ncbi:hypothetical protein [Sphingomicrobium arenosum]|uniref:hypothetical protein n=1 Tax=Sphingomicrobium arenosum TaxID=2233861 RepID=UPI002240F490|nr:hypothetical protein [Sphingomicrobium arenosum]